MVLNCVAHRLRRSYCGLAACRQVAVLVADGTAAVEALTEALSPPGELWPLEPSPDAATVAILTYRGRRIGYLGSTVTGNVADRFLPGTAGKLSGAP